MVQELLSGLPTPIHMGKGCGKMGSIVVVADEKDACFLIERVLSALGYEMRTFMSAQEAMEWLRHNVPDLAILDIKVRGTDELSLLQFIRQTQPHTRVMVITAYPSVDTTRKALELGIEDYLVKPIEIDELEDRVRKAMGTVNGER